MNTKHHTMGWLSGLLWGLATLFGLLVAGLLWFLGASAVGENAEIAQPVSSLLIMLVTALSLGTIIALAQWYALRFYVRSVLAWFALTVAGFLVSEVIVTYSRLGWLSPRITFPPMLAQALVFGGVLGAAQWLAMRGRVDQSARWIAVSLVGWGVAGLLGVLLSSLSYMNGSLLWLLGLFFGGAVFPPIAMGWLFRRSVIQPA